jgi:hypothetical protein
MPTRTATRAVPTLDRQVEAMKLSHLYCRSERHMWEVVSDRDIVVNASGAVTRFTRHTKCNRCESEKFATFSVPDFQRERTTIVYSAGYLARGGRLEVNEVRREQLNRQGLKIRKVRKT